MVPTKSQKERSRLSKEEWREYTRTVWQIANTSDPEHPAVFPIEIPRRLIKLFSFDGETVLDPFAGVGTTAIAAIETGRQSISIEQNGTYAKLIRSRCRNAGSKNGDTRVIRGDSRDMSDIPSDSIGLIVTSPPYWNKADYGKGDANLGNQPIYTEFISTLRPVFEETVRVLMPGRKLCVITANVNQHTEYGLLTFPIAADIVHLLREIGLLLINEIVWTKNGTGGKWGSYGAQRPIFGSYPYPPNFLFKNVHEHILIFAKRPARLTTGRTVVPYDYLQGNGGNGHRRNQRR